MEEKKVNPWMPKNIDDIGQPDEISHADFTRVFNEAENLRSKNENLRNEIQEYKVNQLRVMNLIGDVILEAQENPQRLIAFNSPLLGLLLLEHYGYKNDNVPVSDMIEYAKYEEVIKARNNRVVDKLC